MTILQIQQKYGLPARVRTKLYQVDHRGKIHFMGEYLYRTITRRLENGHYMQVDEGQPQKGEFQMCYDSELAERLFSEWEFLGVPGSNYSPSY